MIVFSWDDFEDAVDTISESVSVSAVYGIPRGGLILATAISYKLGVPLLLCEQEVHELSRSGKVVLVLDDARRADSQVSYWDSVDNVQVWTWGSTLPTNSVIVNPTEWFLFPWETRQHVERKIETLLKCQNY